MMPPIRMSAAAPRRFETSLTARVQPSTTSPYSPGESTLRGKGRGGGSQEHQADRCYLGSRMTTGICLSVRSW